MRAYNSHYKGPNDVPADNFRYSSAISCPELYLERYHPNNTKGIHMHNKCKDIKMFYRCKVCSFLINSLTNASLQPSLVRRGQEHQKAVRWLDITILAVLALANGLSKLKPGKEMCKRTGPH